MAAILLRAAGRWLCSSKLCSIMTDVFFLPPTPSLLSPSSLSLFSFSPIFPPPPPNFLSPLLSLFQLSLPSLPLLFFLSLNYLFSFSSLLALSLDSLFSSYLFSPSLSFSPFISSPPPPPSHSLSSSSGAALWPRPVSGQYPGAEHNPECPWGGLPHSPSGKFRGQGLHQTLSGLPEGGSARRALSVFQHVHSP